ncbi:hypothetical protein [uncultured Mediterranean phage uvDeep-CGR2-KM19-C37]|nr:hypothetical protein [uncultured Mediterranean phage uvDeep-CGR2-KM19-C37]
MFDMLDLLFLVMAYMFSVEDCCGIATGIECSECDTGTTPLTYQVTFDNVEDNLCTECDDFNTTTFVIPQSDSACLYQYFGTMPCDSETKPTCIIDVILNASAAVIGVGRDVGLGCGPKEAIGVPGTVTTPRDCRDDSWSGVAMIDQGGTGALNCKWSTASTPATADAIPI